MRKPGTTKEMLTGIQAMKMLQWMHIAKPLKLILILLKPGIIWGQEISSLEDIMILLRILTELLDWIQIWNGRG